MSHVPRLICTILRSFKISFFSTDLLKDFSYSSFNLSVLMRRVQCNLVFDPLHEISVSYCLSCGPHILFSKVSSASLIIQSVSCALPAIYSDSWATMDTVSEPGVEGTSFRAISQFITIIEAFLMALLLFSKVLLSP